MKHKLFTFFVAALMSASMYAESTEEVGVLSVAEAIQTGMALDSMATDTTLPLFGFDYALAQEEMAIYNVAEAIAAADAQDIKVNDSIVVRGVVTKLEFKGTNFVKYGTVNVYVADVTGAQGSFEFYNCYSLEADTFRTSSPAFDPADKNFAYFTSVTNGNNVPVWIGDTVMAIGKYNKYNSTYQLNTGCHLTEIKAGPRVEPDPAVDPDPIEGAITVAQAIELVSAMGDGKTSTHEFTVEGYVVNAEEFSWAFASQLFFLADDAANSGSQVFEAYYCYGMENDARIALINGDKVQLTGHLRKYVKDANVTPEISNAPAVVVEKAAGDRPAKPEAQEITVAQALAIGANVADKQTTTEYYSITGYITKFIGSDGSFWMADAADGGSDKATAFEVYKGVSEAVLQVGDKVNIFTRIKNYSLTIESETSVLVTVVEALKIDTINVATAVDIALTQLEDNEESNVDYAVIGYVARIRTPYNSTYMNITFYMTDTPSNGEEMFGDLQVYRGNISAEEGAALAPGDRVMVIGKLKNDFYNDQNSARFAIGAKVSLYPGFKIYTESDSVQGNVHVNYTISDEATLTATPNPGYHFTQWSDGNTDNPRTIILASDTTFTAEFAKNTYSISTTSANPEWGTTAGDTAALYLDEVEISATANHGYHFVRWNDNNTYNPRWVSVTEDKTYTATFAKNVYSITKNAEHGTISGNSSAEYLDFVTLTVTPDYGYHFTQWSDGLKDNPRIAQITQDTTFTAEFAYDRVGTCGKDLALVWSYDPNSKVLTIGNAGEFTENMQFGAEAPNEMEELVIGNSVTAIGANAFAGIETLKKITIGESVKTIGEQAFFNCVNLETIFNYRPTPTNTYSNAFDGVDKFECVLYVLPNSIDMYKAAAVWRDFYYTYAIGAEEATVATNDVQVEPQDNAATLTWPTSNNAASYTIQITKDGVVFCTLVFNSNGQLTGIAFAPSRDGQAHAPQAIKTANGLQFTVTGLDSGTQYGYNVTAKDANDQLVATYSGEFTTTSEGTATGIEEISSSLQGGDRGRLILLNGQIFILRGDKTYTLTGQEVK